MVNLHFVLKQVIVHWLQSKKPLEKVVASSIKENGLGSRDRKILQSRIYLWSRVWPLFAKELDEEKIDSTKMQEILIKRIKSTFDWTYEDWSKEHEKAKPKADKDLKAHLLKIHGLEHSLVSFLPQETLQPFHVFLHNCFGEAPLALRCKNEEIKNLLIKNYPEVEFYESGLLKNCLKTKQRWAAVKTKEYANGLFEIQDESSQLVSCLAKVEPGMKVLDMCAGAGGKTLHLASMMQGKGVIHAWDPSAKKLSELQKRLRRWGYTNVQPLSEAPTEEHKYDMVLVDAPCSSSGTLRRRPAVLKGIGSDTLVRLVGLQRSIIDHATKLVSGGGILAYATCSVFNCENWSHFKDSKPSVESFFEKTAITETYEKSLSLIPDQAWNKSAIQLAPSPEYDGDGFFFFQKKC